ncbi:hypothetical protein D3874_21325 [Oleomonas cavernae]|uniref:Transposase DDE domain-containing protein n=1 Tax=Oleomonas cavernae TaxID=2320859 RepID=A0A418WGU7_9PROT|nr:hypothetical protein D3874_21325 [Oleomonas cavernae]
MQGPAGIVVTIAGWMLDPVLCAGMTIGAPRVDLAALVELQRLLIGAAIRAAIVAQGAQVVIPSTTSRRAPIPYDRVAYKARNLVERLWCRLKDWRRIATRYDKLARNFLAAALIAASITYWRN